MSDSIDAEVARRLRRIADAIDAGQVAGIGCEINHTDQPKPVHEHLAGIDTLGTVSLTYEGPADAMSRILTNSTP